MMLWKCCTQYVSKFGKLRVATGLEKVSFHSNPKERQCQRILKLLHKALISHTSKCILPHKCTHLTHYITSKVILKILQAMFQQYMNCELLDVQTGFRKGKETRDQIAIIFWVTEKSREYWKNIYFFIDYAKAFECVDHNKLWKILKRDGLFLKPPYLSSEKPVCRSRSNS